MIGSADSNLKNLPQHRFLHHEQLSYAEVSVYLQHKSLHFMIIQCLRSTCDSLEGQRGMLSAVKVQLIREGQDFIPAVLVWLMLIVKGAI